MRITSERCRPRSANSLPAPLQFAICNSQFSIQPGTPSIQLPHKPRIHWSGNPSAVARVMNALKAVWPASTSSATALGPSPPCPQGVILVMESGSLMALPAPCKGSRKVAPRFPGSLLARVLLARSCRSARSQYSRSRPGRRPSRSQICLA